MAKYTFDEHGDTFNYFLLTTLAIILIPTTYLTLFKTKAGKFLCYFCSENISNRAVISEQTEDSVNLAWGETLMERNGKYTPRTKQQTANQTKDVRAYRCSLCKKEWTEKSGTNQEQMELIRWKQSRVSTPVSHSDSNLLISFRSQEGLLPLRAMPA